MELATDVVVLVILSVNKNLFNYVFATGARYVGTT